MKARISFQVPRSPRNVASWFKAHLEEISFHQFVSPIPALSYSWQISSVTLSEAGLDTYNVNLLAEKRLPEQVRVEDAALPDLATDILVEFHIVPLVSMSPRSNLECSEIYVKSHPDFRFYEGDMVQGILAHLGVPVPSAPIRDEVAALPRSLDELPEHDPEFASLMLETPEGDIEIWSGDFAFTFCISDSVGTASVSQLRPSDAPRQETQETGTSEMTKVGRSPRANTLELGELCWKLKKSWSSWSQQRVAAEASIELGRTVTTNDLRYALKSIGKTWPVG